MSFLDEKITLTLKSYEWEIPRIYNAELHAENLPPGLPKSYRRNMVKLYEKLRDPSSYKVSDDLRNITLMFMVGIGEEDR